MQMRPEVSVGKVEQGSLGLGDPAGRGPVSGGAFVSSLRLKIPNVHLLLLHPPLLYHLPCPPSPGQATEREAEIYGLFNKERGVCLVLCVFHSNQLKQSLQSLVMLSRYRTEQHWLKMRKFSSRI